MEFLLSDPFRKFLGCEVEEVREGYARVKGVVRDDFLNIYSVAHGGFIMALADFAFAISANTDTKRVAVKISMNFYSPAEKGDLLTAEAEKVKGKRLGFYRLRVFKGEEIIAEGSAIAYG
ncbi:MAG: hotdog fold thioesterase [Archaeoglobaceae archaeon]|nr:hotdog fold thioesterase [Archaeoglobaceae archaeon]MDW8118109.1 hotdog fold thioesterase [Archaeoglobaceae archaeon]